MYKKIDSPFSAFNNLINDITKKISNIFYSNDTELQKNNEIIFDSESIIVLNTFKLINVSDNLYIKVIRPLNKIDLKRMIILEENFIELSNLYFKYLLMYTTVAENYDAVPYQLINNLVEGIVDQNESIYNGFYNIPYQNKIQHLFSNIENDDDKLTLMNIYNRYSYLINFSKNENRNNVKFTIYQVLSSEHDVLIKNTKALRFKENNVILTGIVEYNDIRKFVNELFIYGNITESIVKQYTTYNGK